MQSLRYYAESARYDLKTRQHIARHPKATFNILDRLKSDRYNCVRQAVARNVRAAKTVLNELKNDRAKMVCKAVICNINTSIHTLIELSNHADKNIANKGKLNLEEYLKFTQQAQDKNTHS